jgi:hypothetical protein
MLSRTRAIETLSGIREEFSCSTCGQRMVRFIAKQTSPAPSDVWRFDAAQVTTVYSNSSAQDSTQPG